MAREGINSMKQSESIKELATAMAAAQGEMGSAIKGASNPFFKSKYADLGSVIQAIKAPFAAHGLSYVQFPITGDNSVGVITRLMHSSGEWLEQEYFIPLGKMDAQSVGSCLSYARRYSLQAIAGIPAEDDDGNAATQAKPESVTKAQAKVIGELIKQSGANTEKFCIAFKCKDVASLSASNFDRAKELLEKKIGDQEEEV
jgi:hypothetical protein